eukprot:403367118
MQREQDSDDDHDLPKKKSMFLRGFGLMLTTMFFPAYAINVALKTTLKLPFMPVMWIVKKFYPHIVDDVSSSSKKAKENLKEKANKSFLTMSSLIAKAVVIMMTLILSLMTGLMLYSFFYYMLMPGDIQQKNLTFYVSSTIDQRVDEHANLISQPQLIALIPIGNQNTGVSYTTEDNDENINLDEELFNIDVEFTVQESDYNLQKGNIYVNAEMTSYRKNQHPLIFHRISHIEYKSNFIVWIKDVLRRIPLLNLICSCEPKQVVTVRLIENFNNNNFRANALRITLSNNSIVFIEAVMKIRPALFGLRYIMRSWFFTAAFFFTCIFTCISFVFQLSFFFVVRQKLKKILIQLYPPKDQKKDKQPKQRKNLMRVSPKRKSKGDIRREEEQSDLFSDFGETSVEEDYRGLDEILKEEEGKPRMRREKVDLESEEDHKVEEKAAEMDYDPNKLMEGRCVAERIFVFIIRALIY